MQRFFLFTCCFLGFLFSDSIRDSSNEGWKEFVDKDGVSCTYDSLNRLILKKSELFEESWEYDGEFLKSYKDPSGLVTNYEYDEFSRKTSEDCGGRKKEFLYDKMGYLKEIRNEEFFITKVYDSLGRIIQTSENGFNKTFYEYDEQGRKVKIRKVTSDGEAVEFFYWNMEGQLIKHIHPLFGETEFLYETNQVIEIDSVGNSCIKVFDDLKRVIRIEKRSKEKELFSMLEFNYDSLGRVVEEIESGAKRTTFNYDLKGRVASKITPNGISIHYQYDTLDRIVEMKSSDGSVWYEYKYTSLDLTEIKDLLLGKCLQLRYTKFHELTEEIGFFGFKTSWYYDFYGRKKEFCLPDGSSISYKYKGSCMKEVLRFDTSRNLLYSHCYTKFDTNQHVEEEKLPLNFGIVKSKRDSREMLTLTVSPYHKLDPSCGYVGSGVNKSFEEISVMDEKVSYDGCGNLIKKNNTLYKYDALNRLTSIKYEDGKEETFIYDPLSRLVCKNGEFYLYDQEKQIGKVNKEGKILELKVLGLGVKGAIGAEITLEKNGKIYIPIHDFQGNIICLLDRDKDMVRAYDVNTFEETTNYPFKNFPYRPYLANFPYFINKSLSVGKPPFLAQEFWGVATIDDSLLDMMMILPTSFKFNFSNEEKAVGSFNLMDYFPQLFRGAENKIAIVTYMNGKNISNESWKIMGRVISGAIPEGVITIGVYNETNTLKGNLQEKNQTEEENALILSKFFMKKKELFNKVCKDAKILHICDKEADRIYNLAFELLSDEGKDWVEKHIYVLSITPLEGILENSCINAVCYKAISGEFGDFLVSDFNEKIYQSDFQKDLIDLQKKVGFYKLPSVTLSSSSK